MDSDQDLQTRASGGEPALAGYDSRRWRWLAVFGVGLALWFAAAMTTELTQNVNLVPTVVLLGSFLVPVTAVVWNFDHEADSALSGQRVLYAFVVGGVLGTLGASVLEAPLIEDGIQTYLGVGLIEELVKLLALLAMAWGLTRYTTRDGIVLGAAVGFGFAALETSGYSLDALLTSGGASLSAVVTTQVTRGVLSPLGHGLWGAILGGVLFHAAGRAGRLRFTWGVSAAFLLNSVLHALWDSMRGFALLLTMLLTATAQQAELFQQGLVPQPEGIQLGLFLLFEVGGMVLVAVVGIGALLFVWLAWGASTPAEPGAAPPAGAGREQQGRMAGVPAALSHDDAGYGAPRR